MNAFAPLAPDEELDDERFAAVRRLEDDLCAVADAVRDGPPGAPGTLAVLRRRSVTVYRLALLGAAGVPEARVWTSLALSVAAFLAYVAELRTLDPAGRAAERRLCALAADVPRRLQFP